MSLEIIARQRFLEEYRYIRHAEGRGSDDSEYYCALPECPSQDPNARMWAMRAKTYSYFERRILKPLEMREQRPLDVLDLGAGNCWLSHRLSLRGHRPVAIDIFADDRDGLRAARHYSQPLSVIEADFDHLPFSDQRFDLAIFNAALHYSADYVHTLSEVRRCLRRSGSFVILDSPVYRRNEHGLRMVEEKHAQFLKRYGFRSDALPSIDFLDLATLDRLKQELKVEWQVWKPWYGFEWHLRPLKAMLSNRRPPSKFWILVGRFLVE
jgi:ubiquinone/menaquinone biosynthesis C-methylase UbiE